MRLDEVGSSRSSTPSIPFLSLQNETSSSSSIFGAFKSSFILQKAITPQDLLFSFEHSHLHLPAVLSSLPPEILFQILSLAHSASSSQYFILSGQFSSSSPLCSLCSFRTLGSVCRLWHEIMKELFWSEMILGGNAEMSLADSETEKNGTFWNALESDDNGNMIRKIDASLRIWSKDGFRTAFGKEKAEGRESSIQHDRRVLNRVLLAAPLLQVFDADFEYFAIIPSSSPSILPNTIRTLTMRNIQAIDAIHLTNQLPLLTNLTIRLALDFFVPSTTPAEIVANCQLTHFTISVTGYAETDIHTVVERILSNSKTSLKSLTVRNKKAAGVQFFIPVFRELVRIFGNTLEELRVFDIPTDGLRKQNEKLLDWFESNGLRIPQLLLLHICGINYTSELLSILNLQSLHSLIVEDFDSEDSSSLTPAIRDEKTFPNLKSLHICTRILGWKEYDRNEMEEVCREEEIELKASWNMSRMEKDWW